MGLNKTMKKEIIYWKEEEQNRKWKIILNTKQARKQAIEQGAMFFTWTLFSESYKGNGQPEPHRWGDFPLDFDSKKDPEQALKDIKALCLLHLPELYGVDPYAIEYFLSGGKGFHGKLSAKLFDAQEGDIYLPLIYKRIAADWKERFNLTTLDLSIYNMGRGRMFRIANVKRENGRYKVPLSLEDVRDLPIDELWKLSESPREVDPVDVDIMESDELGSLYRNTRFYIHNDIKERPEPIKLSKEDQEKLSANLPQCIAHILSKMPPKSEVVNFNRLTRPLITYFQMTGYDETTALEKGKAFIENYPHSETYDTPEKRFSHWRSQWGFFENNDSYEFNCGDIKSLGLPGYAFDCSRCINGKPEQKIQLKPIPNDEILSLDFPYHVMSGVARDFAELYSSYLETPKEFLFMSFLCCLGAVLSRRLTLSSEIRPQPRLNILLLGESADVRKSTALDKTTEFFRETLDVFSMCWGIGSAEGLQKRLGVGEYLLLCYDEFKAFISKCKIKNSVLLPCVNILFESNRYETHTKDKDFYIDDAYLSILAASTIETYERTWEASFTDIGFNNRLFIVPGGGARKYSFPKKVPEDKKRALGKGLGEVLGTIGKFEELDITTKARELYHNWYMNFEKSVHNKRLDTYAMRLMSLFAVIDLKNEIDVETIQKTIALCDWQFEVRKIHDPINADSTIARVEETIRRKLKQGPANERDLKRAVHYDRIGIWIYERAMDNLRGQNEMQWDKKIEKFRGLIHE